MLQWKKKVTINQVQITFDTGARRQLRLTGHDVHYFMQVRGPQETASNFHIDAMIGTKYQRIVEVKDNYQRRVVYNFDAIETNSIRFTVEKTHGDELAKIFEVRCYNERM